jgi:hypothetical protein
MLALGSSLTRGIRTEDNDKAESACNELMRCGTKRGDLDIRAGK